MLLGSDCWKCDAVVLSGIGSYSRWSWMDIVVFVEAVDDVVDDMVDVDDCSVTRTDSDSSPSPAPSLYQQT